MPKFYSSVILLINESKEICEKLISVYCSKGGHFSPLMHVPLLVFFLSGRLCQVLLYLPTMYSRGPYKFCGIIFFSILTISSQPHLGMFITITVLSSHSPVTVMFLSPIFISWNFLQNLMPLNYSNPNTVDSHLFEVKGTGIFTSS